MIERIYGDYYVTCDACGKELDGVENDFQDTVDKIKANGWKITKLGEEWLHYCPDCTSKINRPGSSEFAGV